MINISSIRRWTVKVIQTGRSYPEKKDPSYQKIKMDGVTLVVVGKDFWNGPWEPGQKGFWERGFYVDSE
jgi:hypothetical protein